MEKKHLKFFGVFFAIIVLVLSMYFVLAGIDAPTGLMFDRNDTANYDNDGNFTVNWTSGANAGAQNYSIYIYADDVLYTVGLNDTDAVAAFSFSNLTDDGNYTFTIEAVNATDRTNSTNISMIVDTTIPALLYTTGTGADSGASSNDFIFVNVTATDINNVSSNLVFSLYNSTGLWNQTQYSYPTSGEQSINWTGLVVNVAYEFNVTANDSATNSNTTSTRTFTLDNVAPTVTLAKKTSGSTSLTITISGVDGTCTVDRSGATISGSTLTETSLSCGNSYSYTVTCTDTAGNAGSSSATSFSTTGCSSSDSGTSTGTSWTNTFIPSEDQLDEGYTQQLKKNSRVRVTVGGESHHVGVLELTETQATIEIASDDPVQVVLNVGEDTKVDVLHDNFYDIYVLLVGIENNEADVIVKKIHEEVPEGTETPGEEPGDGEEAVGGEEQEQERNLTWLWILIGVLVVAIAIGGGVAAKRKNLD